MRLAGVERRRRGQKVARGQCAAMRGTQPLDHQRKTDEPGTGDRHAAARKFCRPPRRKLFVDGSRGGALAALALALATFWPRLRRSTPSHGADELTAALNTERPRWKSAAALTI